MKTFKKPLIALFACAFLLLNFSCSSSRKTISIEEGWDLLGENKVNFVKDKDEVIVYNTERYTALRFKVENKDVRINELKVVFQNGDKLDPVMDDVVQKDQFSKVIELSKLGTSIRSINFRYRSTGSILKGRANVLVFGKRYVAPY